MQPIAGVLFSFLSLRDSLFLSIFSEDCCLPASLSLLGLRLLEVGVWSPFGSGLL